MSAELVEASDGRDAAKGSTSSTNREGRTGIVRRGPVGVVSTRATGAGQLPVTSRANRSARVLNSDAAFTASMVE